MTMKYGKFIRKVCVALIVLVLISVFAIFFLPSFIGDTLIPMYYSLFPKQCSITTEDIVIEDERYNPGNNFQNKASVWMAAYNEKLYFHPTWCSDVSNRTKYYEYLSVFDCGTAVQLIKIEDSIVGMQNGFVFYRSFPDEYGRDNGEILRYSIRDGKSTSVLSSDADCFFSADGILHLSTESECYAIQNGLISPASMAKESYLLNNRTYTIEGRFESETIIVTDAEGAAMDLSMIIPKGRKSIIPCEKGLLVHNEGQGELLYLIRESDGAVVELFTVPCMKSISAVNIHDNLAFISFSRYRYDELLDSTVPYENDSLSGTYQINLDDCTVRKISNSIYTGLYIFDDSGIFACDDNCHIYKLDFEGNLVDTLLS